MKGLGYKLIHVTPTNLIFADSSCLPELAALGDFPLSIEGALDESDTDRAVRTGFDGSVPSLGSVQVALPWRHVHVPLHDLGVPRWVRAFLGALPRWKRSVWFRVLRRAPGTFARRVRA